MNLYKKLACYSALVTAVCLLVTGCQKFDKPGLGDYIKDNNPPGGPLNFYLAFDGTTTPAMNAVDSIRASFPVDNPLTTVAGISGKAIHGENKKFVKYSKPNDWAIQSKSFTISFWIKRDGQTKNNTGTNGPEFPLSFKSSNGHWSEGSFFILLEGNNTACAVKTIAVDKTVSDNWMTWEGGNSIPGLLDNAWHHLAFVYDATSSKLTLYKDGVPNGIVPGWGSHGNINFDNNAISEVRIGGGPGSKYDTDDWLSSTWKGDLDQFRMYSKALSAAEVSALFASKL
jgi:Concanavalin A-like lectin/glucanases superfamily